jgi:formylglycine-generating enzyme required for sulfatase activity
VVGVSFWEAEAFCHWTGGRLPTEREWEAVASGPAGHEHPWGGSWENGICNTRESGLLQTSPVGLFPRSRQKELGIEDLAGNVWEWCSDEEDSGGGSKSRVVRGGAWFLDRDGARGLPRRPPPGLPPRLPRFSCGVFLPHPLITGLLLTGH